MISSLGRPALITTCLMAVLLVVAPSVGLGKTPHETVQPSLVAVKATARDENNLLIKANANGFIVSDDGLILTVYKVISDLGAIDIKTLQIAVKIIDDDTTKTIAVIIQHVSKNLDLILLKAVDTQFEYKSVGIGDIHDFSTGDTLFTSSFSPSEPSKFRDDGKGQKSCDLDPQVWLIDGINFEDDKKYGSPVYNHSGEVIGIGIGNLRGEWNNCEKGNFIPLHLADTVLTPVSYRRRINELLQRIEWEIKAGREGSSSNYDLAYSKVNSPKPFPVSITYKYTVTGKNKSDGLTVNATFPSLASGLKHYKSEGVRDPNDIYSGWFPLQNISSKLKDLMVNENIIPQKVDVQAIPVWTEKSDPKTVKRERHIPKSELTADE